MMTTPKLCSYQTEGLEMLFASLFLALGLSVLLTGGDIIRSQLYGPMLDSKELMVGGASTLFGSLSGYGIWTRNLQLRRWCMIGAALVWIGFGYFYLTGTIHKVGAVTCFLFAFWCLWCEYHLAGKLTMMARYDVFLWQRDMEARLTRIEEKIDSQIRHREPTAPSIQSEKHDPFQMPRYAEIVLHYDGVWPLVREVQHG